ncbi:MAG TPA: hypothetical protein VEQ65_13895 [Opitutus sp.]|nr:hypothetical protein [Opitutus sp.]
MNLNHAFGFLFVGTVFGLLPRFAPGWCPANGVDGTSAREIWLQLMSALLIGVAVCYIIQRACSALASMLEYDPQQAEAAVWRDESFAQARPATVAQAAGASASRPGTVLPVAAAAFRTGLLEQRPAA